MRFSITTRPVRALAGAMLLAGVGGCGGGGTVGPSGASGADGLTARIRLSAEPPGTSCAAGGVRIEAGLDADGNGVLDASEVATSQTVCAGVAGPSGLSALVVMVDEAAGPNCAQAGKRINVGLDSNADGVLAAAEITSSGFVCHGVNGLNGTNGANGTNGTNGSDGLNTLLSLNAEPAGANCPYGGSRIRSGLDGNVNGVLDPAEVDATSYVCAGAPGPGLLWSVVTGTAQQAAPNNGYIAANDFAQVVVTLPASAAAGDIVRVAGGGAGGWKIAQNAGQTINGGPLGVQAGVTWTPRGPSLDWAAVASSADGRRLIAAEWNGALHISNDRGATWSAHLGDVGRDWIGVASSADGQRLVAVEVGGTIHTSDDGGATWTDRMTDTTRFWRAVASSADGMVVVAAELNGSLYVSTDGGVTWTQRANDTPRTWISAAVSADGTRLFAAAYGDSIYLSTNGGLNWTPTSAARNWSAVASSADGMRLVAAEWGGFLYTSSDSGLNWTPRDSGRNWGPVASSADGRRLLAAAQGGMLYTSSDAGVTWTSRDSNRWWLGCAMSAAGDSLVAVPSYDAVAISTSWTRVGPAGWISGGAYDSVELQSLGDGRFNVIGHEGGLSVD